MLWQPTRGILQPNQHWRRPQTTGGALGLQTSLIAAWEMESTSWLDSHGTNHLTGNGAPTVSSASTPKVGNYALLQAASVQYLSVADNTNLNVAGNPNFSIAFWVWLVSTAACGLVTKRVGGDLDYFIDWNNTAANRVAFSIFDVTITSTQLNANTFGALSTGQWYFIACTGDFTNNVMKISINNGTQDSVAIGRSITGSAGDVRIGAVNAGAGVADARFDQVCFWKGRVLTLGEISSLYNSGAGLSYAAMA